VEGGLDDPELDDPPVDVELVGGLEEPEELVGGLEDPEELVGGLEDPEELVGGLEVDGGGARRSMPTDPLNEEVTVTNAKAARIRRKRMFLYRQEDIYLGSSQCRLYSLMHERWSPFGRPSFIQTIAFHEEWNAMRRPLPKENNIEQCQPRAERSTDYTAIGSSTCHEKNIDTEF